MSHYTANLRDIEFCLFDLLKRDEILGKSIFKDIDRDTSMGMLEEIKRLAENDLGDSFEVVSTPSDLVSVRTSLQKAGIDYDSAETSFLPTMSIPIDGQTAKKVFELIEAIEELDDVQNVYGNFDVSDEVMASLSS